jgi:hypothetical protein
LRAADVGVFYLAGRCHNDTDQPLKAEVSTPLPEACFPDGPAARVLNAAPKAATSFKILTVLTRQTGRVSRRGQWLPIRIQAPGGDLLAEQTVHLPLLDPLAETPPVVGSLAGGKVSLLVTNTTDRPQALAFEMTPPPDVKLAETNQSVEIAAGAKAEVAFAMPGQVFATAGFRRIPYRVTVAKSGPQAGEVIAELRVESRWWVTQRQIQSGPAAGSEGPESTGNELDGLLEGVGLADSAAKKKEAKRDSDWTAPSDIFKTDKPSPAWRTLTHGASLWVSKFSPLPKKDTIVQAATRVISPADREAVIKVASESVGYTWVDSTLFASCDWGLGPRTAPFVGRVWLNGEVIYDSRPDVKAIRQNARLRKGANTLLVQCLANAQGADHLGNIFVLFFDARTGARMTDLELDMEKR